jgi:serine/threonine protein phosphatase 1
MIYVMSDMHGCLDPLEENLLQINLKDPQNKLIFCGDYIDYGLKSCETIYKVKGLTDLYPDQVIALMGNHEQMFVDFLNCNEKDVWNFEWLGADRGFKTVRSFVSPEVMDQIEKISTTATDAFSAFMEIGKLFKEILKKEHQELINWIKTLPYYYETEDQIFVHAGIDEEAEDLWMYGTPSEYFTSKYPATFGSFYKDIIAGHIATSSLKNERDFHDVFWDGQSHYFLDGTTAESGVIPLLRYDRESREYRRYKKGRFHKICR